MAGSVPAGGKTGLNYDPVPEDKLVSVRTEDVAAVVKKAAGGWRPGPGSFLLPAPDLPEHVPHKLLPCGVSVFASVTCASRISEAQVISSGDVSGRFGKLITQTRLFLHHIFVRVVTAKELVEAMNLSLGAAVRDCSQTTAPTGRGMG